MTDMQDSVNNLVGRYIGNAAHVSVYAIVHTGIHWGRQVYNETPFAQFCFVWDNPKWAYVAVKVRDMCWRNDYHAVEE